MESLFAAIIALLIFFVFGSILIAIGSVGTTILSFLFLLGFIIWIIIKRKKSAQEMQKQIEVLKQAAAEKREQEKDAYAQFLANENVPEDHIRICITGNDIRFRITFPSYKLTPALLWKENNTFIVLPLAPEYLRFSLSTQDIHEIIVSCSFAYDAAGLRQPIRNVTRYNGRFADKFQDVAFNVYYTKPGDYNPYTQTNHSTTAPDPIIHYYGAYQFAGLEITTASAKAIHEKYGIPYVAKRLDLITVFLPNFPRGAFKRIDAEVALYNDGLISKKEFEMRRRECLAEIARMQEKDRYCELTSLLKAKMITREEANTCMSAADNSNEPV